MPLVDLDKVRDRLLDYGWIADARVSRRLPDTLLVDIVERTPSAVWQNQQKLWLVDAQGVVLEQIALNAMPDLPLVIGPDANRQIAGLTGLMKAAPALDPMLAGATWVGNRRWDLRFQSGEVLALPQGDKEAAAALVRFARMDGMDRLLGRGFVRFDMRDPTKFVVRVPRGAGKKPITEGEGGAETPTAAERAEG
jgi:cell division protein FtsQ